MYPAFRDLLSFTSIDDAVDKLFRVYLDTKLIELAAHLKKDNEEKLLTYWDQVLMFRRDFLDAYTLPLLGDEQDSKKEKLTKAAVKFRAKQAQFEVAQAYLYWFDLRASYWSENPPQAELLVIIRPSTDLEIIRKEAVTLRQRIAAARAYREFLDSTSARTRPHVEEGHDSCARTIELLGLIVGKSDGAAAALASKSAKEGAPREERGSEGSDASVD